jgi:hypothetical protein
MLGEAAFGQIGGGQQLAAALGGAHELEPLGRAALREIRIRHGADSKG